MKTSEKKFLQQLQRQAHVQSKLEDSRFFPRPLDPMMAFIGNNPWQVLLVLSALSAVVWRMSQVGL